MLSSHPNIVRTSRMEQEEDREEEAIDLALGNMSLNTGARSNPRSCKAATLSAWIAFLTFSIVIFHALMSLVEALMVNEKFWQQTEKLLTAVVASNGTQEKQQES